ncbi:MAG: PAS domain S-box protein, partial [Desulfobacterales bacterium]|nr:PAS domain S-box protein [Desulfobacterales bacterium]
MAKKPTYEQLQQRVKELEEETAKRKRADEELQKSQIESAKLPAIAKKREELQEWIDTFDTFVAKYDPNGIMLFCNEPPIKAGGLTQEDVFGKYFPDTTWWSHSETERAKIVECFKKAKAGLSSRIETNFRSASGAPVPIIFNCQPVVDQEGNVKYITAEGKIITKEVQLRTKLQEAKEDLETQVQKKTAELKKINKQLRQDITERKRAEEALRKQQGLFKTILAATPDLLVLKDLDSVYQATNPAFCKFIGKKEEEIIGKTDFDLFPHAEAEIYRRDDSRVMETRKPQVQDEEVTGIESKRWLQVAKTPVLDETGEAVGILCSVRDISDRKRAEEALRKSEEDKTNILQTMSELVLYVDTNMKILWTNRAAADSVGLTTDA